MIIGPKIDQPSMNPAWPYVGVDIPWTTCYITSLRHKQNKHIRKKDKNIYNTFFVVVP